MEIVEAELTDKIIGAAIDAHRELGPGLLEPAYEACLCHELLRRGIPFERQKEVPVTYRGLHIDCGYRIDVLVAEKVILELRAVEALNGVHEAQILTYMKLAGIRVGLLINFNETLLKNGMRRYAL